MMSESLNFIADLGTMMSAVALALPTVRYAWFQQKMRRLRNVVCGIADPVGAASGHRLMRLMRNCLLDGAPEDIVLIALGMTLLAIALGVKLALANGILAG